MSDLFDISIRKEVAYFEMNLKGSSVNVFTRRAAEQIIEFFETLDPKKVKMVVFKSSKHFSFLNGAELVMTKAIKSFEDIKHYTDKTRRAYECVAQSPVPTVAAVAGNCFGCGMEFILTCDYRLASHSFDTQFYLTELIDYYLLPLFGSSFRLAPLVGLTEAVDMLVFGKKLHSQEAWEIGLIDRVISQDYFEADVEAFIQQLTKSLCIKRHQDYISKLSHPHFQKYKDNPAVDISDIKAYKNLIHQEIDKLPPLRQQLHRVCFTQLYKNSLLPYEQAKQEDTVSSTFSTLSTISSREATNFFFQKEMARIVETGSSKREWGEQGIQICICENSNPFCEILSHAFVQGVEIQKASRSHKASFSVKADQKHLLVKVIWGKEKSEFKSRHMDVVLYFPFKDNTNYVEVFCAENKVKLLKPFLSFLHLMGWMSVTVVDREESPVDRLCLKLAEFLDKTSAKQAVLEKTLWMIGFEKNISLVIMNWRHNKNNHDYEANFLNTRSLNYELALECLDLMYQHLQKELKQKVLKHESQANMLMQMVFGFPTALGGFMEYVKAKKWLSTPILDAEIKLLETPRDQETRDVNYDQAS